MPWQALLLILITRSSMFYLFIRTGARASLAAANGAVASKQGGA